MSPCRCWKVLESRHASSYSMTSADVVRRSTPETVTMCPMLGSLRQYQSEMGIDAMRARGKNVGAEDRSPRRSCRSGRLGRIVIAQAADEKLVRRREARAGVEGARPLARRDEEQL